jgi:hypothetical protein
MYAASGLVLTLAVAGVATLLLPPDGHGAVWFAAGLAYLLQVAAFAALVAVRQRHDLFLLGYLGGLVMRFGAVGAVYLWLRRSPVLPLETTLVGLVAFLFILLMLEPVFLRRGLQTR